MFENDRSLRVTAALGVERIIRWHLRHYGSHKELHSEEVGHHSAPLQP